MSTTSQRPARRRDQVEWSRQRLLDAAAEVITERGYQQTTATLIAERAGCSRELVRVRFGSVAALARELLTTEYQDALRQPHVEHSDPRSRLYASAARLPDLVRKAPARTRAALILSFEAATSAREFLVDVEPWLADVESDFRGSLAAAADAGLIRQVDPTETAKLLTAAAIGGAYEHLVDSQADPTRAVRAALTLLDERIASA